MGHYSASTGTCQAAAGGSLAAEDLCFLLGNDARRALLQMLLRYEWREGGQGQGNVQGSFMQTAQTKAERKQVISQGRFRIILKIRDKGPEQRAASK